MEELESRRKAMEAKGAQAWKPVIAVVSVAPPQLAHPPPPRAPLDISPRLRI